MDKRPPENLKTAANQLAQLLASSDDSTKVLQIMEKLNFYGEVPSVEQSEDESDKTDTSSKKIGIWIPKIEGNQTVYIRDPNVHPIEAGHWANIEQFPLKSHKKRVIYLGESVAQGFFFDPYFRLSSELQDMLDSVVPEEIEILDMARSDMGLWPLLALVRATLVLEPDAFVIFAGNNWVTFNESLQDEVNSIAEQLRKTPSVQNLKKYIENWLENQVELFTNAISEIATKTDIPFLFVLPEFNLRDFITPREAPPFLPEDGASTQWFCTKDSIKNAFSNKDYTKVQELAEEMIKLDGGTTPDSFYILANCYLAQDKTDDAKYYFEMARDAEIWHWITTPRCYQVVQNAVRHYSSRPGIELIDLPVRFKEWLNGDIPDRRLFFDYCHLTIEGIQVAMASVAEPLLRIMKSTQLNWRTLVNKGVTPNTEIIARAHFLAAIHNASWGQGYDILLYHCRKACEISPESSSRLAIILAGIAGWRTPALMCEAFQEIVRLNDDEVLYRLASIGPYMYLELMDAVVEAYRHVIPAIEEHVKIAREKNHDVTLKEIDLLDTFYCATSWMQPEGGWKKRFAYYKAYRRESPFILYCSIPQSVVLKITYRVPESDSSEIILKVNGSQLHHLPVSSDWKTAKLTIQSDCLRIGNNEIKICWPVQFMSGKTKILRAVDKLEKGEMVGFYDYFGEISTFVAKVIK
jgi:hypothetical protein